MVPNNYENFPTTKCIHLIQHTSKNCNKITTVFTYKELAMRRFLLLSLLALPVFAADDEAPPKLEAVPEAPEPPLPVQSGENMEPDITIIRKGKKTIEEYRRGGRLYMVKVIPAVGPAYYLRDANGDGKIDTNDLDRGSDINLWKIFEW